MASNPVTPATRDELARMVADQRKEIADLKNEVGYLRDMARAYQSTATERKCNHAEPCDVRVILGAAEGESLADAARRVCGQAEAHHREVERLTAELRAAKVEPEQSEGAAFESLVLTLARSEPARETAESIRALIRSEIARADSK